MVCQRLPATGHGAPLLLLLLWGCCCWSGWPPQLVVVPMMICRATGARMCQSVGGLGWLQAAAFQWCSRAPMLRHPCACSRWQQLVGLTR